MMAGIIAAMFFGDCFDCYAAASQNVDIRRPTWSGVFDWSATAFPSVSKLVQSPLRSTLHMQTEGLSVFQRDTVSCSLGFAAHFPVRARRRVAVFRMSHGL
jgi:hypothetical protein